jgi:hypothetical protein
MKAKLLEIVKNLEQGVITELEARTLLKRLLFINDSDLATHGLTIDDEDYGLYKLRENGECIFEGEKIECHQRAFEIIQKQ